jgi:hypothetical protein
MSIPTVVSSYEYTLYNMVTGGDFSLQGPEHNAFLIHAVVAIHRKQMRRLKRAAEKMIKKHVNLQDVSDLELHAKQIWNGSERNKTAFKTLNSKDKVLKFFSELAEAIGQVHPYIVASICHLSSLPEKPLGKKEYKKLLSAVKQSLIYFSFSRLDRNIECMTGKHIGQPNFFSDVEDDRIMGPRRKGELPGGLLSDVQVLNTDGIVSTGELPVFVRLSDPVFLSVHSHLHRIIQVADFAAYFVGKFLVQYSELYLLIKHHTEVDANLASRINDCNSFLKICELLNVEIVMPLDKDHMENQPAWMEPITLPYKNVIELVDITSCSIREAISSPNKKPRLCGIGYIRFNGP